MSVFVACAYRDNVVSGCVLDSDNSNTCNSSSRGIQVMERTYTCNNGTQYVEARNVTCVPTCPGTYFFGFCNRLLD